MDELSKYFKELSHLDYFNAQLYLESELLKSYQKHMTGLDIADPSFHLKYARLQGQVEALRELSGKRNTYINSERPSSVNK